MPTFLDDPDLGVSDNSSGTKGKSTLNAIDALAAGVSNISRGVQVAQAKQDEVDRGAAIGKSTADLLDIQDEANSLLLSEQNVELSTRAIYEDGVVTPEEKQALEGLKSESDRLERARRTGALSPAAVALRKSALQRQALADVAHLAIQPEINALFNSGVSQIPGDTGSAADRALNDKMDEIHGTGGWGAMEKGKYAATQTFLANKALEGASSLRVAQSQLGNVAGAMNEDVMNTIRTRINENGVLTPAEETQFRSQIGQKLSSLKMEIQKDLSAARARGEIIDQAEVDNIWVEYEKTREFYQNGIWEGELRDSTWAKKLQNINELQRLEREHQLGGSFGSSGVGTGEGGVEAHLLILNASEAVIRATTDPAIAEHLNPSEMRAEAARKLGIMYRAPATYTEMMEKGWISPQTANTFYATFNKKIDVVTQEEAYVSNMRGATAVVATGTRKEWTSAISDFESNLARHAEDHKANPSAGIDREAQRIVRTHLKRAITEIESSGMKLIQEEGEWRAVPRFNVGGVGRMADQIKTSEVNAAVSQIQGLYNTAGTLGLLDPEELNKAFQETQEVEEEVKADKPKPRGKRGSGARLGKAAVRSDGTTLADGNYTNPNTGERIVVSNGEVVEETIA